MAIVVKLSDIEQMVAEYRCTLLCFKLGVCAQNALGMSCNATSIFKLPSRTRREVRYPRTTRDSSQRHRLSSFC